MKKDKALFYSMLVVIAGIFWGVMGVFVRMLNDYGISSIQVTTVRFSVGVGFLALYMMIYDKSLFKISLKGFGICAVTGVFSCLLMSTLYFVSIEHTSMSVAAILLYTAPVWVILASVLLYGETFNLKLGIALVLAFAGCVLVSGFSAGTVSTIGIVSGLAAGFAYALYSILGKYALKICSPYTVTFYSFLVAAICAIFICKPIELAGIIYSNFDIAMLFKMLGIGFVPMFLPFLLYTIGLSKIPAGRASILATIEPMTATVFGMIVYGENPGILGFIGIACILIAVVMVAETNNTKGDF